MGAPGVGKTTFASTFPKPLLLSTDGNYNQFNMPAIKVNEVMELDGNKITGLKYIVDVIDELTSKNSQKYETIIFDLLEDFLKIIDKSIASREGKEYAQDIP